jgi:group I intron endonuclease
MSKICGIYKITSPSGKIYIGKSNNVNLRWNKYKKLICKNQVKLYNSFLKYGVDSHIFEIIEELSLDKLNEREIFYISYYNSCIEGLNCTSGGDGVGYGIYHPNYNKTGKLSKLYGRKNPEHGIKMKGRKLSENHKEKIKLAITGKTHSEETKRKIGESSSQKLKGVKKPNSCGGNHHNAKKVTCTLNNRVWECAKDCWDELFKNKISYGHFKMMLSGNSNNKTTIKYLQTNHQR